MIESGILEGQGERVRLSDLDPVGEPAAGGQDAGHFDELGVRSIAATRQPHSAAR
jgi:hypothetical protein